MHALFAPASEPLDIDFLVLPDVSLLSLAATIEPLRAANRVAGRVLYRRRLLSPDGRAVPTSGGLPIPVEAPFSSGRRARLPGGRRRLQRGDARAARRSSPRCAASPGRA